MTSDDLRKEARRIFDTVCVAGRLQLFEEAEHELRHEDGFEDSEYPLDLIESRCVDIKVPARTSVFNRPWDGASRSPTPRRSRQAP